MSDWLGDPCWDIEETEGFEAHRDELIAFRETAEAKWKSAREEEFLAARADVSVRCGCPDNLELATYLLRLEERIDRLENMSDLKI